MIQAASASHPRTSFVCVLCLKFYGQARRGWEHSAAAHWWDGLCHDEDGWCLRPPQKHESASPLRRAEHPFGAEPTWSLRSQGRWPPPSSLRAATESRESRESLKGQKTPMAAVGSLTHTHVDASLVCFEALFLLVPHCSGYIAAHEPHTNNGASPLARAWARNHSQPITARQYYMCAVSQYWNVFFFFAWWGETVHIVVFVPLVVLHIDWRTAVYYRKPHEYKKIK